MSERSAQACCQIRYQTRMDRQYQTDDDAVECGKEGHHLVDGEQLAAASVVRPQCL